jgi:hypothetical protein
MRVERIW